MDPATIAAALVPFAFVIYWLVGALKDVTNLADVATRKASLTSLLTRAAAFGGAWIFLSLYAHSELDLGGSLAFVSKLPWQGLVLLSIIAAASGGTLADGFRTFNRADTTVQPRLLPSETTVVPPAG